MSAVMTEPENPPAPTAAIKCQIEDVFGGPFIELIALAPKNPVVRGLILAQTRKLPGPECETFEQIKVWVETNCERKSRPHDETRAPCRDGIVIKVEFSETEHGRANYSVPRYGTDEFVLDEEELINFVQAAIDDGDGVDVVVDKIAEEINDNAWNRCDPSLDDSGDYNYDDHESSDSTDGNIEFSRSHVRERLLTFLRERHPNLLEELA